MTTNRSEQGNCSAVYKVLNVFRQTHNPSYLEAALEKLKRSPINKEYFKEWMAALMDDMNILTDGTYLIKDLILGVPWLTGDEEVGNAFCQFIMRLVTVHNYHAYDVLGALFIKLKFNKKRFSEEELSSNYPELVVPKKKDECVRICNLICAVVQAIPLAYESLNTMVRKATPYTNAPASCHMMFLYNMILLSELIPSERAVFFTEIFHQINALDLVIDRDTLEEGEPNTDTIINVDCDASEKPSSAINDMIGPVVQSLDIMMIVMFRYIHSVMHGELDVDGLFSVKRKYSVNSCIVGSISFTNPSKSISMGCECKKANQNEKKCKLLYFEMRTIFLQMILPTYLSSHIQYLMFYMLSIRPTLIYDFIDILKMNFESHNNSLELRRNAIAYIGSLLTRSRFIPFKVMYSCLEIISKFCLSYISRGYDMDLDLDALIHAPFYYAAQVLFYVFTFRYKEFTSDADGLAWARALHLDSIVNSHMNPLRKCLSAVAMNFAAVSCHFQLAYCYTIMERNSAFSLAIHQSEDKVAPLEFLPFEPYLLPRSAYLVDKHFVEFSGLDEEIKLKPVGNRRKRKRSDSSSYNFLSCSTDLLNASY